MQCTECTDWSAVVVGSMRQQLIVLMNDSDVSYTAGSLSHIPRLLVDSRFLTLPIWTCAISVMDGMVAYDVIETYSRALPVTAD